MEALEALVTRTTIPQVKMAQPGPDKDQLRRLLEAGASAPDHGKLRPWRFLVVQGESRDRLGLLFAQAVQAARPDASAEEIDKQRAAPSRAPLVIVVIARINESALGKIPEIEQICSAAAAAQNMLVAAHAMGLAGKWSTGKNAYDPTIRQALGVGPKDHIVGFLYIGSPALDQAASPRPALDEIVEAWPDGSDPVR